MLHVFASLPPEFRLGVLIAFATGCNVGVLYCRAWGWI